jgi:hypothetical protein
MTPSLPQRRRVAGATLARAAASLKVSGLTGALDGMGP